MKRPQNHLGIIDCAPDLTTTRLSYKTLETNHHSRISGIIQLILYAYVSVEKPRKPIIELARKHDCLCGSSIQPFHPIIPRPASAAVVGQVMRGNGKGYLWGRPCQALSGVEGDAGWHGGGGREGVKSVIPASAVTCPTCQCMMSVCSRF